MSANDLEAGVNANSPVTTLAVSDKPEAAGHAPTTLLVADKKAGAADAVYKIAIVDASEEISDPSPLGLFAFALSTLMFGLLNVEASPASFGEIVMPLVIFHGGLAQLIAGIFEFTKKNVYGATTFTTWGTFFMGVGVFYLMVLTGVFADKGAVVANPSATAIVYTLYGVFALALAVIASQVAIAIMLIFGFASLLFFVGAASGYNHGAKIACGVFGILTGLVGLYSAIATLVNASAGKYLIPLGRLKKTEDK